VTDNTRAILRLIGFGIFALIALPMRIFMDSFNVLRSSIFAISMTTFIVLFLIAASENLLRVVFSFQLVGGIMNSLVTVFNNGRMPVADWQNTGINPTGMWQPISASTNFPFLADIYHLGRARYSLGDLFIFIPMVLYFTYLGVKYARRSHSVS